MCLCIEGCRRCRGIASVACQLCGCIQRSLTTWSSRPALAEQTATTTSLLMSQVACRHDVRGVFVRTWDRVEETGRCTADEDLASAKQVQLQRPDCRPKHCTSTAWTSALFSRAGCYACPLGQEWSCPCHGILQTAGLELCPQLTSPAWVAGLVAWQANMLLWIAAHDGDRDGSNRDGDGGGGDDGIN